MTRRRFWVLLNGLSAEAMFRRVAGDQLAIVDDRDQISRALTG